MIKKCMICGIQFKANSGNQNQKFCSKVCYGKWRRQIYRGSNNPAWKGGKPPIKKICQTCKKQFFVYRATRKYCSSDCYIRTGKFNPRWKGGISTIGSQIRRSNKYKEWKQCVFIRDSFKCQKCGQIGGILHAHHKVSFKKIIDEIKVNLPLLSGYAGAMIYAPLWNVDNGITLCIKCHKKTKTYLTNYGHHKKF